MATKVRGNSVRRGFSAMSSLTFDRISAAGAFSVTQVDSDGAKKVRRCEDYCRSHHSSTSSVRDIPAHDSIHTDTYVSVIQRLQQAGFDARVWCQDLWASGRLKNSFYTAGDAAWPLVVVPFGSSFRGCFFSLVS